MNNDAILTMPLYDALLRLCAAGAPVRVVPVTPPAGAAVQAWRVARVARAEDGVVVVAAVGEIEGQIGCTNRLGRD